MTLQNPFCLVECQPSRAKPDSAKLIPGSGFAPQFPSHGFEGLRCDMAATLPQSMLFRKWIFFHAVQ